MMDAGYYAGWDGGGTATTIECIDKAGNTVLRAKVGPLNVHGNTIAQVSQSVREALQHMDSLPGGLLAFEGLCVAGAGVSGAKTRDVWEKTLSSCGYEGSYHLSADFEAALYGAFGGNAGIALISGTGSVCYGKNSAGEHQRCGGWGHRFDDEGSGYAIGRDVLKAVVRAHDGREQPTLLTNLVFSAWNVNSIPELISTAYAPETGKKEIAALSALCCDAYADGDNAAEMILEKAAKSLEELLTATADALTTTDAPEFSTAVETAFFGGLLQKDAVLHMALENSIDSRFLIREPIADAARGAAIMSRHKFRA